MDKNANALAQYFEQSVETMLELMARARRVEFHIRLLAEASVHREHLTRYSFDDFVRKHVDYPRKKLERHIKDILPEKYNQIIVIRQCADSLAHADYRSARQRVDEYKLKFGLAEPICNDSVGLFFYENIQHPDGATGNMGYLVKSSPHNLILEEFRVFEGQGYLKAAEAMLGIAERELQTLMPNLPVIYGSLVVARGLKHGTRATVG
jgi:hypothetical protein